MRLHAFYRFGTGLMTSGNFSLSDGFDRVGGSHGVTLVVN